jgi:hypothetical protein
VHNANAGGFCKAACSPSAERGAFNRARVAERFSRLTILSLPLEQVRLLTVLGL